MTFQGAVGVPFASNTTIGSGLDRAKKLCLMSKHWSQKRNQCFYMNQTDQTRAILTANLEGQLDSGVWVRIIVLHFAQQFGPPRSGRVGEAAQPSIRETRTPSMRRRPGIVSGGGKGLRRQQGRRSPETADGDSCRKGLGAAGAQTSLPHIRSTSLFSLTSFFELSNQAFINSTCRLFGIPLPNAIYLKATQSTSDALVNNLKSWHWQLRVMQRRHVKQPTHCLPRN